MKKLFAVLLVALLALPLLAQNPDFDRRFQQAQSQFNQSQFEKARTTLRNALKNLPGLSSDQKSKANSLINQCNHAITVRDRLNLSTQNLDLKYISSLDSVGVDVAKISQVTAVSSAPTWCKVEKIANGQIYIRSELNPDKQSRQATVTVSLGKTKTVKLTVNQEARPETFKRVAIRTKPDRARISIDGENSITGLWEDTLPSGKHKIHIEKAGFAPKDTVITIQDDLLSDQDIALTFKLKPNFGRMTIKVTPEEGFEFDRITPYTITINGRSVNMMRPDNYSYNDDREVLYYEVYDDGTIPVPAGWASVIAAANNFETQRQDIQVLAQDELPIEFNLKARTGSLSIIDTGKARNAEVYLDDTLIGTVGSITNRRTVIGDHVIRLKKDNHIAGETSYPITIKEDEETFLNVSMSRFANYYFDSTPSDAKVFVNDEYIGNTPTTIPYIMREKESGSVYKVLVAKDHYLPIQREYSPNFDGGQADYHENFNLKSTYTLRIEADEADLQLTVKDRRNGDSTYVDLATLPADLDIPIRKKPYYVELHRIGQSTHAYRGTLKFDSPDKKRHYIQSWSKNNFQFLSFDAFVFGMPKIGIGSAGPDGQPAKSYRNLGNVNLVKFSVFGIPGLSTSLIRGAAFYGTDSNEKLFTTLGSGSVTNIENATFLPAVSILFINGEFRIGGALLSDYSDICAVASYAWYPDIVKSLIGFSHIVGHDLFVGGEVSSRLPIANVRLKAGLQMYPSLKANLYSPSGKSGGNLESSYSVYDLNFPNMFVVSLGISLGPKSTKGDYLLRIF